jgi:hypothetical protein
MTLYASDRTTFSADNIAHRVQSQRTFATRYLWALPNIKKYYYVRYLHRYSMLADDATARTSLPPLLSPKPPTKTHTFPLHKRSIFYIRHGRIPTYDCDCNRAGQPPPRSHHVLHAMPLDAAGCLCKYIACTCTFCRLPDRVDLQFLERDGDW